MNSESINIINSPEKYLLVKQYLIPDKEFYTINDKIRVGVEIRDMRFKNQEATLDNVSIYEIIDKGLNITSRSEYCYRILNITNLVNYKNFLFVGLPDFSSDDKFKIRWNDSTNIANIDKIRYLQGHQRLVYWYNVTPKRFGKFNINTVIRTNQYSDFESYRTILVPEKSKPNLKVVSVIDKNEITQYDLVSIKYYITCIDDSTISKDWNISISLEESDKGYMIKESPTKNELKRTIEKDQTISPNWTIIYPNVGKYKIPGLKIDGELYPSSDVIDVVSFYTMHYNFLSYLGILFSIFVAAITIYLSSKGRNVLSSLKEFFNKNEFLSILILLVIYSLSALTLKSHLDPNIESLDVLILKNWSSLKIIFYISMVILPLLCLKYASNNLSNKIDRIHNEDRLRIDINKAHIRFSEGFAKSNASIAASVFTDDSMLFPPDANIIYGKREIEEFWSTAMASGIKDVKLNMFQLSVDSDMAIERGTGTLNIHPLCGTPCNQSLKYIIIWRYIDDQWKNMLYVWNILP